MERFATDEGLRFVSEFDLEMLRKWRGVGQQERRASKKLELVRCFTGFAHDGGWIHENTARKLKAPKVSPPQTLPYDEWQMADIYTALAKYRSGHAQLKMRAFVLVLRGTGIRIGDTVSLGRLIASTKGSFSSGQQRQGRRSVVPAAIRSRCPGRDP